MVIIIDNKSDNTEEEVRQAAVRLENEKIRVIPVALGREADIPELTNATLDKDDVIKTDKDDDPEKIADEIIMKASEFMCLNRSCTFQDYFFSNYVNNIQSCPLFWRFYVETARNQQFTVLELVLQIYFPRFPAPLNIVEDFRIFLTHL